MVYNGKIDGVDNFIVKVGETPPSGLFVYRGTIYDKPATNSVAVQSDGSRLIFDGTNWENADITVGNINVTKAGGVKVKSSTASSRKKMKISVIDDGTISATEET